MSDIEALGTLLVIGLAIGFGYGFGLSIVNAVLGLGIKRQSHA